MKRIGAEERVMVSLTVNGRRRSGHATPRMLLSDFLRHEVGLPGTHTPTRAQEGSAEGESDRARSDESTERRNEGGRDDRRAVGRAHLH